MDLSFRKANKADLDRLIEIHLVAYPDERSVDARARNFCQNRLGPLENLIVVERRGQIAGFGFLFEMQMKWRSTPCAASAPVSGIATVAVAPEHRHQGVAGALLTELHRLSKTEGALATLLYPFRESFYAAHGYGRTSPYLQLSVAPESLPRRFAAGSIAAATAADRAWVEQLFFQHGPPGTLQRSETTWERLWLKERRNLMVAKSAVSEVIGFLSYEVSHLHLHGETVAEVNELVYADPQGLATLLGFLRDQAGQVDRIELRVPQGSPIVDMVVDADFHRHGTRAVEHPMGTLCSGPMLRVHDRARLLNLVESETHGLETELQELSDADLGRAVLGGVPLASVLPGASARLSAALSNGSFFCADTF
jgi:predicted acetyltransferase